jgi:two-component system response regulator AgrA
MITILIVDDEKRYRDAVVEVVNKVSIKFNQEITIKQFEKYNKEFKKEIDEQDSKKIYILDIDLNDSISGVNIAECIRSKERNSEIIFITNHDRMFDVVYRNVYDVFAFIEKFHNFKPTLEKKLTLLFKKDFDNGMFTYSNRVVDLTIYYRNILYIHCAPGERKIVIVTDSNEYTIGYTLQEMLKHLDNRFKIVHRACIVNTDRVEEYCWSKNYFVLDTGEKVDYLSKKYKKDVIGK